MLILNRAVEFAVIIPGVFICFMPVKKWIKVYLPKLYFLVTAVVAAICFFFGYLCAKGNYYNNVFFIPIMSILALGYFSVVNLEKRKLWYLFLCATAALSFAGLANDMTEAMLNPHKDMHGYCMYGITVQYLISLLILGLFYLVRNKLTWIFENFHSKSVWRTVWVIPALITFCNLMMCPLDYANVRIGKIFFLYLLVDFILLFFFLMFQFLFYQIAVSAAEKYAAEKTAFVYQAQIAQYQSLQAYMEQTSRLRHDFKHVMATVGELIQNRQYDELQQYTNDYHKVFSSYGQQSVFCRNAGVNAILSYYANLAKDSGIQMNLQVQIPDQADFSEIDVSILFGNLLDNAIYACKTVSQRERYINLTADTDTPGSFYIVMANSFDGKAKEKDGRFFSTKTEGSSIGLSSIRTIAEKYHGIAEFYVEDKEFISNIMMRL